jgi:hypothetical protein
MTLDTKPEPMGWKLFLVDRDFTNDEIATTFAEIFKVNKNQVFIIEDNYELNNELTEDILIVCEKVLIKGDFKISLSIYLREFEKDDEIEVVEKFSEILNCNCLILDPFKEELNDEDACLLVQGKEGYIQEVYLNTECLNDNEYIILASEESEDEESTGWKQLLFDLNFSNNEIASTLAKVVKINKDSVMILQEHDTLEELSEDIQLLCHRRPVKGDFQFSLLVYPQNFDLQKTIGQEEKIVAAMCHLLNCNCLIIDFSMDDLCTLVRGTIKDKQKVYLDIDRLIHEEFVVIQDHKNPEFKEKISLANHETQHQTQNLFHCIDMDRYYFLYEYRGRLIRLPKDSALGVGGSTATVLLLSEATYENTNETLSEKDSIALEHYLTDKAQQDSVDIIIE